MDIAVLFGTFILLVVLTAPIGYAIGMATLVTLVFFSNTPLVLITQNAITGVDSFPLMAIPFFMLAGNLMSSGGVARRIVNFCDTLLGWITGGLGIVTTLACMIFAAISGSAVATTSAIGGFMIPEMTKRGYDKAFSASLAASAEAGAIAPLSQVDVVAGQARDLARRRTLGLPEDLPATLHVQLQEADIVARDGAAVVFVEVKTRSSRTKGLPAEAVGAAKRERYEKIAAAFLAEYEVVDVPLRFDVVSIVVVAPDRAMIRHHINSMCEELSDRALPEAA